MLDIDITRALRSAGQLKALIEAILTAQSHDELDWVEWKREYDLGDSAALGHIARHILGMANRDPTRARNSVGGCGYIVVGVEPARLGGLDPIDPATLEPQIGGFFGDGGPVWQPLWQRVHDKDVLVIVVDPPELGDPIHTLNKQFAKYDAGDVFVRRQGATHKANPEEIRRLTQRATGPTLHGRLQVELRAHTDELEVRPIDLSDDSLDAWIEQERHRLLAPLERAEKQETAERAPENGTHSLLAPHLEAVADLGRQLEHTTSWASKAEDRSPEEYRSAIEQYLVDAKESLLDVLVDRHVASGACRVELVAANPTDQPFRSVEFELSILDDGVAATDGPSQHHLPKPPRMWGPRRLDSLGLEPAFPAFDARNLSLRDLDIHGPREPWVDIDNSGSARLRFSPIDLAPRSAKPIAGFDLVVLDTLAGAQLRGDWSARSTHVSGVSEGALLVGVAKSPVHTLELMGEFA